MGLALRVDGRSTAEKLALMPKDERLEFLDGLSEKDSLNLIYSWRDFNARRDQIPPDIEKEWDIWLILCGRGWGKTRTGAEWVRELVDTNFCGHIALVAETAADARDTVVENAIMQIFPPGQTPTYEPTKRRVTFYNGAKATTYNATQPDQLRGPEHGAAWSDELAKWKYARETWDQLQFGLRAGITPKQLVTTTPRPINIVKSILAGEEGVVTVTRGHTLDNRANLAPSFLRKVVNRYKGTRLGKQELRGEVLSDVPNALWRQSDIDAYRVPKTPKLVKVVVAVDPGASDPDDSMGKPAENGIVVVGLGEDGLGYVLEDASLEGTPLEWARRAKAMRVKHSAICIVAEKNNGGEMVRSTILSVSTTEHVKLVWASKGKEVRAEPVSSLYEQGRIRHVGAWPKLEDQMCQMTTAGYVGGDISPDRVDALVWGLTELFPNIVKEIKQEKSQPYVAPKVV